MSTLARTPTQAASDGLSLRSRLAIRLGTAAALASRRTGRGGGSVIGGRVTGLLAPTALTELTAQRNVVLVSGTNGKSTTTRMLWTALAADGPVASNLDGANLRSGVLAALAVDPASPHCVLEVDELALPAIAAATGPAIIVLLNLSRDQMDRMHEVRRVAQAWRVMLTSCPTAVVIANADDPLVSWAAAVASRVIWVAAGQPWQDDMAACPSCAGQVTFEADHWSCACGLSRPAPVWALANGRVTDQAGRSLPLRLGLPGRANQADAVFALAAAATLGLAPSTALDRLSQLTEVAGRYAQATVGGHTVRLLLAKNPAGWLDMLDLLVAADRPAVLAINAGGADGRDPSWLWDVPFERLGGRSVVAAGDRADDLAVRLRYADVTHRCEPDPVAAVAQLPAGPVDLVANYTAFQQLRRQLCVR